MLPPKDYDAGQTSYGEAIYTASRMTKAELKHELGILKSHRGQSGFSKHRLMVLWAEQFGAK